MVSGQNNGVGSTTMVNIVFPFYNETDSLPAFERELEAYLSQNTYVDSITLVNDGSSDHTGEALRGLVDRWTSRYPVRFTLIDLPVNQGKGSALRAGVMASQSPWVVTMDADLAYSPHQIDSWIREFGVLEGAEKVYIGSRALTQSQVEASYLRRMMSWVFSTFVYWTTGLPFRDTQSGFKMYPGRHAKNVFSDLQEKGFAHDVEILMRLQQQGIPIKELPVRCQTSGTSSVHVLHDSVKMIQAIFRMRRQVRQYVRG